MHIESFDYFDELFNSRVIVGGYFNVNGAVVVYIESKNKFYKRKIRWDSNDMYFVVDSIRFYYSMIYQSDAEFNNNVYDDKHKLLLSKVKELN